MCDTPMTLGRMLVGSISEVLGALEVVSAYNTGLVINEETPVWQGSDIPRDGGTAVVCGAGPLSSDGVELVLVAPLVMWPRSPLSITSGISVDSNQLLKHYEIKMVKSSSSCYGAVSGSNNGVYYPYMRPEHNPTADIRLIDDLLSSHLESIIACPFSPEARALDSGLIAA